MSSGRLTPVQWKRLRSQFEAALEVPRVQLPAFIHEVQTEDPVIGAELISMLEAHDREDTALEAGPLSHRLLQHALANTERDSSTLASGSVIQDRYEVGELIGEGGFGRVYLAADRRLNGRRVVVKVLKDASSGWVEKRFTEEVHALSRIDHPGIVNVTDSGRLPEGPAFLVMQFVPGDSLKEILRQGAVAPDRALRFVTQLLEALAAAHQLGVLHRDIKPSNILIRDAGSVNERAILIDFGIARTDAPPGGAQTTLVAGSPKYMAPEQLLGRSSAASDIYAMGAVAFEMCTGKALLDCISGGPVPQSAGTHLKALRPPVADRLRAGIVQAVARSESERFQNAAEFLTAITSQPARKRWAGIVVAVVVLLILVAAALTHKAPSAPPIAADLRTFAVSILRQTAAGLEPTRPGQGFHKGDKVEIRLETQTAGHWYVLDESGAESQPPMILLFPGLQSDRRPLTQLRIPESPVAWIDMDGSSRQERVWIVWSRENVADLDEIRYVSAAPLYGALTQPTADRILKWLAGNSTSNAAQGQRNALSWKSPADPFVTSVVLPYQQ